MQGKLLIIEDDPGVVAVVREVANDVVCSLDHAGDGITGLEMALGRDYDVVILDLTLPGLGGLDVCKRLREHGKDTYVLMLTSRSDDIDKILGLELGADDYLTKPFALRELAARVKSLLRRARQRRGAPAVMADAPEEFVFGGLHIDVRRRLVALDQKRVEVSALEFDLLVYFASRPGWVIPRETLTEDVLGHQLTPNDSTLTTLIYRLRRKIEVDHTRPRFIRSVRGVGYCFTEPTETNDE